MTNIFSSWGASSLSTFNIKEASEKDTPALLDKNALSSGVWKEPDEKERTVFPSFRRGMPSGDPQRQGCASHTGASNHLETANIPDAAAESLQGTFFSVSIPAKKIPLSGVIPEDNVSTLCSTTPRMKFFYPQPFRNRGLSTNRCTRRALPTHPNLYRQSPVTEKAKDNGNRQSFSTADLVTLREPSRKENSFSTGDAKQVAVDSKHAHRSCLELEVHPLRANSVVFLSKPLSFSLVDLEERRACQLSLRRSTCSLRLSASSRHIASRDSKPARTDEGYGKFKVSTGGSHKPTDQNSVLPSRSRGCPGRQHGHRIDKVANRDDSDRHDHGGVLSFRRPIPSQTEASKQNGNVNEEGCLTRSDFRQIHSTFKMGAVDLCDRSEKRPENGCSREGNNVNTSFGRKAWHYHYHLMMETLDSPQKTYSLKEALELLRPDFISRSQTRVRRLEQRTQRRRAQQDSDPDLVQGLGEDRGPHRRNCTTPHPLCDNLFKPRERSISAGEMQLRSRRIYNKLPEVTKKKEDARKRMVSQSNRLRAELFKKDAPLAFHTEVELTEDLM